MSRRQTKICRSQATYQYILSDATESIDPLWDSYHLNVWFLVSSKVNNLVPRSGVVQAIHMLSYPATVLRRALDANSTGEKEKCVTRTGSELSFHPQPNTTKLMRVNMQSNLRQRLAYNETHIH